jgi:hypothetical protein
MSRFVSGHSGVRASLTCAGHTEAGHAVVIGGSMAGLLAAVTATT